MMNHSKRAFTLIELLVAMGIIAALVSLSVSGVSSAMRRSRIEKARADVMNIVSAVNAYYAETGLWPTPNGPPGIAEDRLGRPLTRYAVYGTGDNVDPVFGPYLEFKTAGNLRDPWGSVYNYGVPGTGTGPGADAQRVNNNGFPIVWSTGGGAQIIGSWE